MLLLQQFQIQIRFACLGFVLDSHLRTHLYFPLTARLVFLLVLDDDVLPRDDEEHPDRGERQRSIGRTM